MSQSYKCYKTTHETQGFNTNNQKCKKVIHENQKLNTSNQKCKKKQV